MTAKKTDRAQAAPAKAAPALQVSAANFPTLRQFLRGYFHEDWKEEYDTPAEAAQQFCEDADAQERRSVASEWIAFCQQTKNLSLPAISGLLSGQLGAAWNPKSHDDLEAISAVFRQFTHKN
jgi:contact-dependent growth inhibition (CDI) system CdiI-like immunity protein